MRSFFSERNHTHTHGSIDYFIFQTPLFLRALLDGTPKCTEAVRILHSLLVFYKRKLSDFCWSQHLSCSFMVVALTKLPICWKISGDKKTRATNNANDFFFALSLLWGLSTYITYVGCQRNCRLLLFPPYHIPPDCILCLLAVKRFCFCFHFDHFFSEFNMYRWTRYNAWTHVCFSQTLETRIMCWEFSV